MLLWMSSWSKNWLDLANSENRVGNRGIHFVVLRVILGFLIMSTRKRITELSVAELRSQLVKRGVDAAGDRPSLVAKLKKVCTE